MVTFSAPSRSRIPDRPVTDPLPATGLSALRWPCSPPSRPVATVCDHAGMSAVRTVVVLPGRSFGAYVPQLFFPMMAAMRRGAEPVVVSWEGVDAIGRLQPDQIPAWVTDQVASVVSGLDPASSLVVGKSLGSYAAGLVSDLGVPAIWVTPVLTSDAIVAGLRRAASAFLLVGGTADTMWDTATARDLTPHVVEIPGGDHGLFDPGPLEKSASNIGIAAAECERFLDQVVWPVRS